MEINQMIVEQVFRETSLTNLVRQCFDQANNDQSKITDRALSIDGMSGRKYRKFINNCARAVANPRYLEVGVWRGSTLCSAIAGVDGVEAVAIDNFSYGGATPEDVYNNIALVKTESAKVLVLDQPFEDFDFTAHGKFNIYMYDGAHDEESQYQGIVRAKPALTETAIIIVDDWNKGSGGGNDVQDGTFRGFVDSGLEILYHISIDTGITIGAGGGQNSEWHCGYGIFVVENK
jgi:hypothetical protein